MKKKLTEEKGLFLKQNNRLNKLYRQNLMKPSTMKIRKMLKHMKTRLKKAQMMMMKLMVKWRKNMMMKKMMRKKEMMMKKKRWRKMLRPRTRWKRRMRLLTRKKTIRMKMRRKAKELKILKLTRPPIQRLKYLIQTLIIMMIMTLMVIK